MTPIHVIAEAGTNHNASAGTAQQLVDVARDAGADSVKFQIIYPEGLYVSQFFRDGEYEENDVIEARRKGMLADDDYRHLAAYCRSRGMAMSASIFDSQGLSLLAELDPPYIKIASCDLNNSRLLKQAAETGRKLIVSTGMATLGEVEGAVQAICSTGNQDLVLMHCVSVYPCPTREMNLGFMNVLKSAFGFPIGLSDHTENSLAAAAAVALGVTWIEKHFTFDRTAPGFDHAYAMEPAGLKQYIDDIRAIEAAFAPKAQKVGTAEANVKKRARRSLYAARDIAPGEVLRDEDVLILRPEGPLQPTDLPKVVGRPARHGVRKFEPLRPAVVE